MIAINKESQYFLANLKNRRVLGNQSKSISFRTHEQNPKMHKEITLDVQYFGEIITLRVPTMAFITRLMMLGMASKLYAAGSSICSQYDTEQLQMQGLLPKNEEDLHKIHNPRLYNSAEIKAYFQALPKIISFRLFEYEKQILYLYGLVNKIEVVKLLRYLYHGDIAVLNIEDILQNRLINRSEILLALFDGLTEEIISDILTFHDIEI